MSFLPILTQHGAAPPVVTFREDGITMVPSSGPFAHPLLNVIFKALRRVSLPPLASTRIAQAVFLDPQFEHGHTKLNQNDEPSRESTEKSSASRRLDHGQTPPRVDRVPVARANLAMSASDALSPSNVSR
ncbi:hypothetical protein SSPO_095720 [Streptomyces antimycoticus]|uniref:Uncharacterized protein n=1 Tax=Streptomyces antimycoticus TaxID=68175 RepID=A0A499UXY5_9ACTN|nr:hypothetical protein [Streptomyces antimycoticus]BBJ46854.1 hypothetical protein SSPO_095720 [Streptomyces antimycoticus]